MTNDQKIRLAAFNWLSNQVQQHGDVLLRTLLENGFLFQNERIHLISAQGIFKPKQLELPLTITTSPRGPYDDSFNEEDLLLYKYRGKDPMHRDNIGLREVMNQNKPLIYFHGIVPGKYLAVWPVFIIGDDPSSLAFTVAADNQYEVEEKNNVVSESDISRRVYITSIVKTRLHQRGFRERVLAAYKSQCSFCKLKHTELLDAAHIIPDEEEMGEPTINNGLALCKIHHTAFDRYILGVTPDYKIKVRNDILEEVDGPMLTYGLQKLHDEKLILPKSKEAWPKREYLDWRFQKFRDVSF